MIGATWYEVVGAVIMFALFVEVGTGAVSDIIKAIAKLIRKEE